MCENETVLATFLIPIKIETYELLLKKKFKKISWQKNLGFVDSEFVKTCHEHATTVYLEYKTEEYNLHEYAFDFLILQRINFHQHHSKIITKEV